KAGLIRQRDVGNGRMTQLRRADMEKAFPGLLEAVLAADRGRRPAATSTDCRPEHAGPAARERLGPTAPARPDPACPGYRLPGYRQRGGPVPEDARLPGVLLLRPRQPPA